jgi:hypothetical protein
MGRHFDKYADNGEELQRLKHALLEVTPIWALLAIIPNGLLMLYAWWISHWGMMWVFGILGLANAVIAFIPLWWKKVDSRRASTIMLVAIFAGWIANGNIALRWVLALYSASWMG